MQLILLLVFLWVYWGNHSNLSAVLAVKHVDDVELEDSPLRCLGNLAGGVPAWEVTALRQTIVQKPAATFVKLFENIQVF